MRFSTVATIVSTLACQPQVRAEPVPSPAPLAAVTVSKVDTVAPPSVRESAFSFTSGTISLPGTLALPANTRGKAPVALIIAGSGPTDRNGNSPGAMKQMNNNNLHAQLAWGLAARGIATLRYDKRGLGETLKQIDLAATGFDDFIGDVRNGAEALARDGRFSQVYLVGHSEGAQLALQAANRGANAAGITMLAGAGRNILPIMREQLSKQLPAADIVNLDSAFARFQRGEEPGDVNPALRGLFEPNMRKFMLSWLAYEPAAEIARVTVPVLIIQGTMDVQIAELDARTLKAAQPAARLVMIPCANHVFRCAQSMDRMAQVALYRDPTLPIVPELVPTVADWILGRKK